MSKDSPRTSVLRDNDLIRRGDAREILEDEGFMERNLQRLAAIPAVQPTVEQQVAGNGFTIKPLVWRELEKYRHGGKYSADGYTIRYVEGFFILDFAGEGKWVWRWTTIEAAKAAAQADYEARILSALDMQPTVSPKQLVAQPDDVLALVEAAKRVTAYEDSDDLLVECGCDRCKAHLDLRATLAAWNELQSSKEASRDH